MCERFPRKFDVQTSYKHSNYILGLTFVVKIKFPRATYHTIVPSIEELYCLNSTQKSSALQKLSCGREKKVLSFKTPEKIRNNYWLERKLDDVRVHLLYF